MKQTLIAKDTREYGNVPAGPVKSFFVAVLTRDITLSDAILDLLDNSVDGILRKKRGRIGEKRPYEGFHAEIKYDRNSFEITDNCGGIPWALRDYAFRMGRVDGTPSGHAPTVGAFGIGMKRAIFKMGRQSLIRTQNGDDAYEVEINPSWLADQDDWSMPARASKSRMQEDGTHIRISELDDGVRSLFGNDRELFDSEFKSKLATHYAFIINKGFGVRVNGDLIQPKPTELRFEPTRRGAAIQPFIYQTTVGDVDVFLAVGFTHPIPSEDDVRAESEKKQYSSLNAGWTVVCNDRAVLYCDRTELTGWGEAGIPKYHTQFIAISGVVEFRSNNAASLPTTTTKRGIDASSRLYLQVKNKMREGLRIFTTFTNQWKGRDLAQQAQERIKGAKPQSMEELRSTAATLQLRSVSSGAKGKQYKPNLPAPPKATTDQQRISFVRTLGDIRDVSDHLFGKSNVNPSEVGSKCFDVILSEARK